MIKKAVLLIGSSLFFLFFYLNYTKKSDLPWAARIKKNGPSAALAAFKTQVAKEEYKKQHLLMHEFGSALFSALDIDGLNSCDDSFGYGCFHGFILAATKKNGSDAFKPIAAGCIKLTGRQQSECFHGMGHGIISYFGHHNLPKALSTCADTIANPFDTSCAMGVFMEYNFRTMDDTETGRSTRPLDPNNPHSPCDSSPAAYKKFCYLYQANWWYVVYEKNVNKLDKLCGQINDQSSQDSCFRGIGYSLAPSLNYQIEPIQQGCNTIEGRNNRILCLAGASSGLLLTASFRHQANDLCEKLSAIDVQNCLSNRDNPL